MPDTMTTDSEKDLHTAITELILCLKGDGTVSSIQKKVGVHRNMLTAIFEVYDAQIRGNEVRTKSKSNPRIKKLYWGTNSLITVAHTLGIPLSELIRAAEDVKEGLPPWFARRISCNEPPKSIGELGNIFLEALGCLTYADPFPPKESDKRERQYHKKIFPAALTPFIKSYTDEDALGLKGIAILFLENSELNEFVKAYQSGAITSGKSFDVLKNAVEFIKKKNGIKGKIEYMQLISFRSELISAIRRYYTLLCVENDDSLQARISNPQDE